MRLLSTLQMRETSRSSSEVGHPFLHPSTPWNIRMQRGPELVTLLTRWDGGSRNFNGAWRITSSLIPARGGDGFVAGAATLLPPLQTCLAAVGMPDGQSI